HQPRQGLRPASAQGHDRRRQRCRPGGVGRARCHRAQRAPAPRRGLHALRGHAAEGLAGPDAPARRSGLGRPELHRHSRPRALPALRYPLAPAPEDLMRLLLVNPNISDSVSDLIRAEARRSASPGTEIEVLTAPFGVAYIETRFEALVGAYAAAQVAA